MKTFTCKENSRLDTYLSLALNQPRNQVMKLIKTSGVHVNEKLTCKPSFKLLQNDIVSVSFPKSETTKPEYEVDFDIDILYEDDEILVINKPPFLTIHPAKSVKEATLVDWLKSKNFRLSTISGEERHGIVHRIDKQTSGALVVAKTNKAHEHLSKQLEKKSMGRYYLALIDVPLKEKCIVEKNIARNPKNRLQMGISNNGRNAKSAFYPLITSDDNKNQLIAVKLFTGRTHQIRVHLKSLSRHILGDDLYGFKRQKAKIPRVMLHAYLLYLIHPITNKLLSIRAPLFDDFSKLSEKYFLRNENDKIFSKSHIHKCFNDVSGWV